MTTYNAFYIPHTSYLYFSTLSTRTFSGNVSQNYEPLSREILFYKEASAIGKDNIFASTTSDIAGNFSINFSCSDNDKIRAVCVGIEGENSQIFEDISGNF